MNEDFNSSDNVYYAGEENKNNGKKGFAIASLILGIVSVVCCCMGLGFIAAPLSIIFGIIALVKNQSGKPMSIIGIVLSVISIIFMALIIAMYGSTAKQVYSDYSKFIMNADSVIEEYEETGELPDYLEKYTDDEYDYIWESSGYDDFYDFFDDIIEGYNGTQTSESSESSDEFSDESSENIITVR